MKRIDEFKKLLPNYIGDIDFEIFDMYGDVKDVLTHINVSENIIKYDYYYTAECGCCSGKDSDTENLDWYLEHMEENDFQELLKHLSE